MLDDLVSFAREVARDELVGWWRVAELSTDEVDAELARVVAMMTGLSGVVVAAVRDDDCTCPSFIDVLVTRSDGLATFVQGPRVESFGLVVRLSKLAPVAILSTSWASSTDGVLFSTYLQSGFSGEVDHSWTSEHQTLTQALTDFGWTVATEDDLNWCVPDDVHVETFLAQPPWTAFDAWFHEMD